jgi:hypothetical protein
MISKSSFLRRTLTAGGQKKTSTEYPEEAISAGWRSCGELHHLRIYESIAKVLPKIEAREFLPPGSWWR